MELIMGLDMYLHAKRYLSEYDKEDKELRDKLSEHFPVQISEVTSTVLYWRKANAIHQWFVGNVQDDDDCKEYHVSREKLSDLLDILRKVDADHSRAKKLLPTQGGFFFGSTDYDSWYWNEIETTIPKLEEVLKLGKEWSFYYQSSW
jgi:hypothetical protein